MYGDRCAEVEKKRVFAVLTSTGVLLHGLPWELIAQAPSVDAEDTLTNDSVPRNADAEEVPSLSQLLPNLLCMYESVWNMLRFKSPSRLETSQASMFDFSLPEPISFTQLMMSGNEEVESDAAHENEETKEEDEMDETCVQELSSDDEGESEDEGESGSDPLSIEQIEMTLATEDLAAMAEEMRSSRSVADAERYISGSALNELPWRIGDGIEHDHPRIFPNQPKAVGIPSTRPIDIFMHLWPLELWEHIAIESDMYRVQNEWTKTKPIQTQELLCYAGLLISRSLHPWTSGLKNHWRTTTEGGMKCEPRSWLC